MHEPLEASLQGALLAVVHLAYQLPALWSAFLLARRVGARRSFEFFSLLLFFYLAQMIAFPGLLGLAGRLDWLFPAVILFAGILTVIERGKPHAPLPSFRLSPPELLLLAVALSFLICQWRLFSYLPPTGTDSQAYHLYYPAAWLAENRVERITQPGLVTAGYPCYGELVYCWNMLPTHLDFFAKHIQFLHLIAAFTALVAAGEAAGFRRIAALAAGTLLVSSGVVFRSATVANTDVMVGANLVFGCSFLLLALRRNRLPYFLLAGTAFGIAAATKFLGCLLAPPLLFLAGTTAFILLPRCRRNLLWCILAAFAIASPCFLVNWFEYGNPLFPARIGLGSWPLFHNYIDLPYPPVGFRRAWGYFVDGGINSISLLNVLALGFGLALLFLPRRRHPFRSRIGVAFGLLWLFLLALQLTFCPDNAQARQIIPLAMLAAMTTTWAFSLLPRRLGPWPVVIFCLAVTYAVAARQLDFRIILLPFLVQIAITGALLHFFTRRRPKWLTAVVLLTFSGAFLLDAGYRYAVANSAAPMMRGKLLSAEDEAALELITRETNGEGTVIALQSQLFYHYLGPNYANKVMTIPVTASGELRLDAYRTPEEMRTPGPPEAWLERLRAANVRYLVVSVSTCGIPNPEVERRFAEQFPRLFTPLIQAEGFRLYRFEGGKR